MSTHPQFAAFGVLLAREYGRRHCSAMDLRLFAADLLARHWKRLAAFDGDPEGLWAYIKALRGPPVPSDERTWGGTEALKVRGRGLGPSARSTAACLSDHRPGTAAN